MKTIFAAIPVVAALVLTGCGRETPSESAEEATLADVQEETAEAVDEAVELLDQTQEDYVEKVKTEMIDLRLRLNVLRDKAGELSRETRQMWEARIDKLDKDQQALKKSLENVAASTEDAWRDLAKGMIRAQKELGQAVREAEKEINGE
jgi:outer membrane PBP1 activator LpoA protein